MYVTIASFALILVVLAFVRIFVSDYIRKSYATLALLVAAAGLCAVQALLAMVNFRVFLSWMLLAAAILIVCVNILIAVSCYQTVSFSEEELEYEVAEEEEEVMEEQEVCEVEETSPETSETEENECQNC